MLSTQGAMELKSIKSVDGCIDLPGSKSISNRALLLSAQSVGTTRLINLLESDDVNYMLFALKQLGVHFRFSQNKKICEVDGIGGALYSKNEKLSLFLGNSGTSMRLLTAALCLREHNVMLTGESRMKERPIGHLISALRQGGAKIDYLESDGYPPLQISGGYSGGDITIRGNISSQFLSAILMMAPLIPQDTRVHVDGVLVSRPYIDITLSLMRAFGVEIKHDDYRVFYCFGGVFYRAPGNYFIEGDASSASYFLAAAAIRGGTVCVTGVGRHSIQGDIQCADVLEKMGSVICWGDNYISCTRNVLRSVDMDMNNIPDAAMTIAVTALFVNDDLPTVLRNIYNWRLKESDRLRGMAIELRKLGASIIEGEDYIKIVAPKKIRFATINTYNDHRMAMAFSLAALSDSSVIILNPSCVNKTFPSFFKDFFAISTFV
ncbi:3-phosphoshikimate 1-carboxyvinyltransferase [Blochmannia endosymbiont of Polyrhachis (Hedomyrma) turneri]|uniref:3-phosphoshikimate 1-carboxyvinyltransferase n=1 Tax=Blochmannia endosymbiont of Polyrhachis (Hedomyrma) turneri TaxID=1505596 RepID=UPI00061A704F|nr:3-phosphoshikimate 1-carboxyvinyltransferase [Blochmannia endosymbiont of Polyrhachis (Hedomyrma) turneri]AKC59947.1 3-phosphoshikimate 1-carboxyvinyltransferase [Blochmannia endosymbiont of Polyrhachis (Hedomyrma) turneri]